LVTITSIEFSVIVAIMLRCSQYLPGIDFTHTVYNNLRSLRQTRHKHKAVQSDYQQVPALGFAARALSAS
jgi:hypothetical protein